MESIRYHDSGQVMWSSLTADNLYELIRGVVNTHVSDVETRIAITYAINEPLESRLRSADALIVTLSQLGQRLRDAIHALLKTGHEFPCVYCGYTNTHLPDCPWVPLWAIDEATRTGRPTVQQAVVNYLKRELPALEPSGGIALDIIEAIESAGYAIEVAGPPNADHIGWVKHNGAGEIIFRQAGHPGNETELPALGWTRIYLQPPSP